MNARSTIMVPGTKARLSFDDGAKSVGYVIADADTAECNHPTREGCVRIEFPSDDGKHDGEFFDGRATVMVLPRFILVPVCEWVDTYPDEFGLACSEPGVATSMEIPCHFDASTTVWLPSEQGEQPMNFCPAHTRESLRDALTDEVIRLRSEPIA